MFNRLILSIFVLIFVFTSITSCDKDDKCTTENMSFKNDISPILKENGCLASGCHAAGSLTGDYTKYAGVKAQVDATRLLGAIKQQTGFSKMPKVGNKMSDCNISKIEAWITQGTKDN